MLTNSMPLEKLLEQCTTSSGKERHKAWREFFSRYKHFLFYFIDRSCAQWNLPRLNLQEREAKNDILSEVLFTLNKDLSSFKNRDCEQAFIAWLQVVCNRTTGIYLKRVFKKNISATDIAELPEIKEGHDELILWELYESIIEALRKNVSPEKRKTERDINILLLNIWSGFSPKSIAEHPCYSGLNIASIESIIKRMKKKITFF
jgi:hypothetical protein